MQPTTNRVHVDRLLTNVSVAYMQQTEDFIADKVFPVVPVAHKSDIYQTYDKGDWFRDEAKPRIGAVESVGSGYNVDQETYNAIPYALHKDIDDYTRDNADDNFDLEKEATEFVTQRLLLNREKRWADKFFKPGVWGTDISGVAANPNASQVIKLSDYATSDPFGVFEAGRQAIRSATGYKANVLVLGAGVYSKLINHPEVRDRIKYTSAEATTEQMLAAFFNVEKVLVAEAVENVAKEGETDDMKYIFSNSALLAYSANRPSLMAASAGYTFSWRGVSGRLGFDVKVKKFRMEELAALRVEAETAFDMKVVAPDLGVFWEDLV